MINKMSKYFLFIAIAYISIAVFVPFVIHLLGGNL